MLPREVNADLFKEEVLLPRECLNEFLSDRIGCTWDNILNEIKNTFLIPRHTARYRIERLTKKEVLDSAIYNGEKI
jgi:Zn-dependent peptidase ImmA (M78 family)